MYFFKVLIQKRVNVFFLYNDSLDLKVGLSLKIYNLVLLYSNIKDSKRNIFMTKSVIKNAIALSILKLNSLNLRTTPWRIIPYSSEESISEHSIHVFILSNTFTLRFLAEKYFYGFLKKKKKSVEADIFFCTSIEKKRAHVFLEFNSMYLELL